MRIAEVLQFANTEAAINFPIFFMSCERYAKALSIYAHRDRYLFWSAANTK